MLSDYGRKVEIKENIYTMREIKFRGKQLSTGKWLYGDLLHDNQGGCYIYPLEAENIYKENKVDVSSVGQATGVKDKNGKEVYEGDIVTYIKEWDGLDHKFYEIVVFQEGSFLAGECGREICGCDELTIIGNTTDNHDIKFGYYKDV